ncbi:MAG: SH3 domain-containing protein [Clostridia bacterium]|nr:SH3 domain-containing protein [Clostridia bacterium]
MGNLQAESALRPDNLENRFANSSGWTDESYTEAVDSGVITREMFMDGAGYGIAQWTYWSRKRDLYDYAKKRGVSIADLDMQLGYLWAELGQYRSVLNALLNARSVREASDAVLLDFEKPANQSEENCAARAKLGQCFYDQFAGGPPETAPESTEGRPPSPTETSERFLTIYRRFFYNSDCYKQGTRQASSGVQVHSTGANNPWLRRYVQPDDGRIGKNVNGNDHNRPGGNVCAGAYIGKQADGTVAVYEALPWDMRCWLSGSGSQGNANRLGYVGFEICEDALTDRAYFDAAMDQAVLLTAYLCREYGIGMDAVRDHAELHEMGLASNHGDITHWLGKFGLTMAWFRDRVREAMEDGITVKYVDCDEVTALYQARVTGGGKLNIRSGPGTRYSSIGQAADGSILDVLEETNADWARVRQGDLVGYAMRMYLEKVEPEDPAELEIPEDPETDLPPANAVKLTLTLPADALRRALETGNLVIDCRSGGVANINYL